VLTTARTLAGVRRCRLLPAAGLLLLIQFPPSAGQEASRPGTPERQVVEAGVRHVAWGTLEVLVDEGEYLIPLTPFAELAGVSVQADGAVTRLITPLGTVDLQPEEVRRLEGDVYLHEKVIEEKLATPVEFDASRYALDFDLPWQPTRLSGVGSPPPVPRVAAVRPPRASFSTLRSDLRYTQLDDDGYYGSSTIASGRLAAGQWRARLESDFDGRHTLRDYTWFRRHGRQMYLAGNQRVRLHPLLHSIQFTGLQVASTNRSPESFYLSDPNAQLVSRRLAPSTGMEGYGPKGGIAELRINESDSTGGTNSTTCRFPPARPATSRCSCTIGRTRGYPSRFTRRCALRRSSWSHAAC